MKVMVLGLILINLGCASAFGHDLSLSYHKDIENADKKALGPALKEVSKLLPPKFIMNLPKNIEIKISKLSNHKTIPLEVCADSSSTLSKAPNEGRKNPFVYGVYKKIGNSLTINEAVINELKKGRQNSTRINCQHKNLYDQAIATIIHELTHAYDFNVGRVSNTLEFINIAGFKKGLLKIKNKNNQAMRSVDNYELVSVAESFAVNMEYFLMDSEFMCRKPSMFNFYKNLLGVDPFPNRDCSINNMVMTSTQLGYVPTTLLADRVYRIDYLLASPGKGAASGFGHSMLRIIICAPERHDLITNRIIPATPFGEKCIEDRLYHLVVSYRANIEDGKLDYLKGLTGGYPSMLFILNFSDVLDEYNRDELRDVISYPLKLSSKEREEFITRVKEEHWNYRGAYKFITNNCAVETYDLLKHALDNEEMQKKHSLTPNGVLDDLDRLNFTSHQDQLVETFTAKTEQIILAYNKAYGYKLNKSQKLNKKAVVKFIDSSTTTSRMTKFIQFTNNEKINDELNVELTLLKERLVVASSFSVLEQQIFRATAFKYRKKAADILMNTKDENTLLMIKENGDILNSSFSTITNSGYGIPLEGETLSNDQFMTKGLAVTEVMTKTEELIKEKMAAEFEHLEEIQNNILTFNKYALNVRKVFRSNLESYINLVLNNMARENFTKGILVKASQGDKNSLKKVRNLMGEELVTEKEILDSKLIKLINELI